MATGPGKYDRVLTRARVECGAKCAVLIVLDGSEGPGFACQAPPHIMRTLPDLLHEVAGNIEKELGEDLEKIKRGQH